MREALQYLTGLRGPIYEVPLIAFVGHVCRTWYADENTICAVMEILREARMFQPVYTRPTGFDLVIRNIAGHLGLVGFEVAPMGKDETGRSIRDPGMLDGAALVVAFPVEKAPRFEDGRVVKEPNTRESWKSADPELAPTIEALGIPVLAVYRNGETIWIPGGEK